MTVTVSLVTSEAQDVLLVPYSAITAEGPQKYVEVLTDDCTTEKRAITTGLTDYSYTGVTDGLTEGEKILINAATTTAASSSLSKSQQSNGGMMIPGMGGGPSGGPPPGGM
jgi:multidrug efflux pump subunit AcrA (membrane-fusion protein)